jgi:hypothetical protein
MTISTDPAPASADRTPSVRLCFRGVVRSDIERRPAVGDVTLANGEPVATITLGRVAGRDVVIEASDPLYLEALGSAVQLAQSRLAMWAQDHRLSRPCWADPLTAPEFRRALAETFARACKRLYEEALEHAVGSPERHAALQASMECGDLRIDVSERAVRIAA